MPWDAVCFVGRAPGVPWAKVKFVDIVDGRHTRRKSWSVLDAQILHAVPWIEIRRRPTFAQKDSEASFLYWTCHVMYGLPNCCTVDSGRSTRGGKKERKRLTNSPRPLRRANPASDLCYGLTTGMPFHALTDLRSPSPSPFLS